MVRLAIATAAMTMTVMVPADIANGDALAYLSYKMEKRDKHQWNTVKTTSNTFE